MAAGATLLVDYLTPDCATGATLDEEITGVWEDLAAGGAALCPVCESGMLQPVYGAHARPVMGRCDDCHTELT